MNTISQREFRNSSAAVMDAVEAGESYRITRNGVEVAELIPARRHPRVAAEDLVLAFAAVPRVNAEALRSEAEAAFGADRVGDEDFGDPWRRRRG